MALVPVLSGGIVKVGKGFGHQTKALKVLLPAPREGITSDVTGYRTVAPQTLELGFLRSVENFRFIGRYS